MRAKLPIPIRSAARGDGFTVNQRMGTAFITEVDQWMTWKQPGILKPTCNIMYLVKYLVGGLEHFLFSHILEIVIPID